MTSLPPERPRPVSTIPVLRSARLQAILRQAAVGVLTLFILSVVVFGLMSFRTCDDIAHEKFGNQVTKVQINAFCQAYGLHKPVHERYGIWLYHFVQGDMGTSYVTNSAVSDNVVSRFEKTLILSILALLISIPISIALGIFQARRVGSLTDSSMLTGAVVVAALPEFVIGIALLFIFAVKLGWLPTDSTALVFPTSFANEVKAYILPTVTLVLAIVPYVVRIARSSIREALGAAYTQAAVLRGLSQRTVVWDHALRNAGVPLVNAVAVNIIYLLSGVIVVEYVFAFPGVGQGIVQATSTSDAYNVEAIAMFMGFLFIMVSLLADALVAYLNPRLKAATIK